ncbi:MAG: hypothetical protein ACE5D3_03775, partial [Candidatus Binatia bacterium]
MVPEQAMAPAKLSRSIDNLLLRAGLSREQIASARAKAGPEGDLAAEIEACAGLSQNRFAALLAERLGLPFSPDLADSAGEPELLEALTMQFCRINRLLPLRRHNNQIRVATSDPLKVGPLDDLRVVYGCEIEPMVVPGPILNESITRAFDRASAMSSRIVAGLEEEQSIDLDEANFEVTDLLESDDEAPMIRLVNSIIFQAAKDGASDIHVEPYERNMRVRYR